MKSLNIIFVALIAIIATIFIFVISVTSLNAPTVTDENNQPTEENVVSADNKYLTFTSKTLGISFEYPTEWGTITEESNDATPPQEIIDNNIKYQDTIFQKSIILKTENGTAFLASYTDGEKADRGGWWGDESTQIKNEEYLNTLCSYFDTQETTSTINFESCSNFVNLSGATVTAMSGTTDYYGHITHNVDQYYIYHPDNEYYGIIISTVGFEKNGSISDDISEKMNNSIMKLKFIN